MGFARAIYTAKTQNTDLNSICKGYLHGQNQEYRSQLHLQGLFTRPKPRISISTPFARAIYTVKTQNIDLNSICKSYLHGQNPEYRSQLYLQGLFTRPKPRISISTLFARAIFTVKTQNIDLNSICKGYLHGQNPEYRS